MKKSTAVVKKSETIKDLLVRKQIDISQLLPTHVNVDRFIKSALLAIARDEKLQKCTPKSLFTAVINAAELGLDFTPILGHAFLIAYGDQATFMPGWRGLVHLVLQAGRVKQINSEVVFENDKFKIFKGTKPNLIHEDFDGEDRGDVKGAYAIAFYGDGTPPQFEFMNVAQLQAVKNCSKSKDSNYSPYQTFPDEMRRKAPVRRLFKRLPSSPDDKLVRALEYDSRASGIEFIDQSNGTDRISRTASLAESLSPVQEAVPDTTPEEVVDTETGEVTEIREDKPAESEHPAKDKIDELFPEGGTK